jgi:hypothetical protein
MKKLFLLTVLLVNFAFPQYVFKQSQILTDSVIIKTKYHTPVVAYTAGDVVRDSVSTHNMFPIRVVGSTKTTGFYASGYVLSASLVVDTASAASGVITNGNFSALVFTDSAGYYAATSALVDTNNAPFQMKHAIQYNFLAKISFSLTSYGTTAVGSTMAFSKVEGLNIPFNFGTTGKTKLWVILICDGSYTPKKGGSFELRFDSVLY